MVTKKKKKKELWLSRYTLATVPSAAVSEAASAFS